MSSSSILIIEETEDRFMALQPASGRWTAGRKAQVVLAIAQAQIRRSEALRILGLSEEELAGWERRFQARGQRGLHSTRLQEQRP